jgi:uridine phosphorylase
VGGHHIHLDAADLAGNGGLGRYVLLPGDPSRARTIAERFADRRTVETPRGFDGHLGTLDSPRGPIDVLAIPTGIGAPAAEVVIFELLQAGARRLLRVGSCGAMAPEIAPGQVVIATGAVRDDGTSAHYAPLEFPALAHPAAVAALRAGAERAGLAGETYAGICHSKASLYAREFGFGPAGEANLAYCAWLRRCGVVASEMECAPLFVLAATFAARAAPLAASPGAEVQAGAVLAVFAADDSQMQRVDPALAARAQARAIDVALEGVRAWAERDRG